MAIQFGYLFFGKKKFTAKILENNVGSRKLFEKLKFKFIKEIKPYDEVEY